MVVPTVLATTARRLSVRRLVTGGVLMGAMLAITPTRGNTSPGPDRLGRSDHREAIGQWLTVAPRDDAADLAGTGGRRGRGARCVERRLGGDHRGHPQVGAVDAPGGGHEQLRVGEQRAVGPSE